MDPTRVRLDALTGIRYWAALTVVISHVASDNEHLDYDLLRGLSTIGMPLFFVLSGFLLCYNYYSDFASDRPGTLTRFYWSRFARIYPAYLLALLLSFSFMGNFFHDLRDHRSATLLSLGFDATLTQSWIHRPVFTATDNPRTITQAYLGIGWSVSTEVFFYATFPLTVVVLRWLAGPRPILVCMTIVWFAYVALDLWSFRGVDDFWSVVTKYSKERWLLNYSPYGRIGEFWIGCLAGRLFEYRRRLLPSFTEERLGGLATWICIPALLCFTSLVGENWVADRLHLNVGLAPICAVLVYCLARFPSALERLLSRPAFVRLGESSYCLFLLHPLVQSFYLPRTRGEDDLAELYVVLYNHVMMFVVLHILALGCHQFFEVPLRTHLRGWLAPHPAR